MKLKIKDNVNLKELNKYGHFYNDSSKYQCSNKDFSKHLCIWNDTKEIEFINGEFSTGKKVLNQLIKYGLTEEI